MKRVLAIDPGSSKCGVAVVERAGDGSRILFRSVVPTETIGAEAAAAVDQYSPHLIVVGDGTKSKRIQAQIREAVPGRSLLIVDEQDTSIRARERYWEEIPRRGWRRLLPSTLQVPPVPIDDFVAVILAERAINAGD